MLELPEFNPNCAGCRKLLEIVLQLQEQIKQLQIRLEKVEREGKRQAAPFRKPNKPAPKKPGRKSGDDHGQHFRRGVPERIDETIDVPLPEGCPDCDHSRLKQMETVIQYQTEIPRRVIHRQFNIAVGVCDNCGKRVQGRHELQTSDAVGAANSQLGPNVHAAISLLNKEFGLSHEKISKALNDLFGLELTRSGSCRSILRTAARFKTCYQRIKNSVRGSPQVVPDETGWRVGGKSAWLHVFVGLKGTCYQIDATRSGEPAKRVLGEEYSGVLVHDGWSVYDGFKQAQHQQCIAHLLRRCQALLETATRSLLRFPQSLKAILLHALKLRDQFLAGQITLRGCQNQAGKLESKLVDWYLSDEVTDQSQLRLLNFLEDHHDSLFTFLKRPGQVDATNWRAEQAIRPAVVNRKVWGGNRTTAGAEAQSILMSVVRTCRQRGHNAFDFILRQLTSTTPLTIAHLTR